MDNKVNRRKRINYCTLEHRRFRIWNLDSDENATICGIRNKLLIPRQQINYHRCMGVVFQTL